MQATRPNDSPMTLPDEAAYAALEDHPELRRMHRFRYVSGLSENPSRTRALFVVTEGDKDENTYRQTLWELREDGVRQLTALGKEGGFTWDGEDRVMFSATRTDEEKKRTEATSLETQIYRLPLDGGEARPAFRLPLPGAGCYPVGEGRYLVYARTDPAMGAFWEDDAEARERLTKAHKEGSYRRVIASIPFYLNGQGFLDDRAGKLFLYEEASGQLRLLTDAADDVRPLDPPRDGGPMLLSYQRIQAKRPMTDGLLRVDPDTGDVTILSEDTGLAIHHAFTYHDKIYLLASDMATLGLNQNPILQCWDEEAGEARPISDQELMIGSSVGNDVSYGGNRSLAVYDDAVWAVWTAGSRACLTACDPEAGDDAAFTPFLDRPGAVTGFARLGDTLYVSALWDMKPAEIYRVTGRGEDASDIEAVTTFNDALFDDHPPIMPRPLAVPSPVGDGDLEGFVLLPPSFDKTETAAYPAILDVHGGPKTVYGEVYYHEMQMWAREGYVVMFCNPHGSDGRGDAFSDIRGRYGGIDYEDLMAFTDAVLEAYPAVDAKRLGVTGGSYGGFMTNWIVTQTHRFAAAATQRSISNWTSFYGVSDIGYYFATDQNGTALGDEDLFETLWAHSPMRGIDDVETPTLVIHAEQDYRCPLEQGYQWFVGLQDRGIPSKMVIFEGENHELSRSGKPKGREERLRRITAWMNGYLKA